MFCVELAWLYGLVTLFHFLQTELWMHPWPVAVASSSYRCCNPPVVYFSRQTFNVLYTNLHYVLALCTVSTLLYGPMFWGGFCLGDFRAIPLSSVLFHIGSYRLNIMTTQRLQSGGPQTNGQISSYTVLTCHYWFLPVAHTPSGCSAEPLWFHVPAGTTVELM